MPSPSGQATAEDGEFVEAADGDSYPGGERGSGRRTPLKDWRDSMEPWRELSARVAGVWRWCGGCKACE
jgi:hypothetical protein